jgi:hypothetical protein
MTTVHVLDAKIGDKYALNRKMMHFWQEHALTESAASSDVFAVGHAQNELTTEPVSARWLEKVM